METKLILYPVPSKPYTAMAKSSHVINSSLSITKRLKQQLSIPRATASPDRNSGDGKGNEINGDTFNAATERRTSPKTLNIRYRARSRRQLAKVAEQEKQQQGLQKAVTPTKKWEEMTLSEKVLELYVGEKGLLFWLNKFAYASIFVVIGGWILFRFVGPSIGLYQLDAPPLSPTSIFKDG